MAFCINCGHQLVDGAKFCHECGTKVTAKGMDNKGTVEIDKTSEIQNLLKRAFMFLEEGKWVDANALLENVLNQDAENAQAYVGKLMIELRVRSAEKIGELPILIDGSINYMRIMQFGDENLKKAFAAYAKKESPVGSIDQVASSYSELKDGIKFVIINGDVAPSAFTHSAIKEAILLDGVEKIGCHAFSWCDRLTNIKIPNSVTEIGTCAFCNCYSLRKIIIPKSVQHIGMGAFELGDGDPYRQIESVIFEGTTEEWQKINEEQLHMPYAHCSDTHELERKRQQELRKHRMNKGLCLHCGGSFKGLLAKKCEKCGKAKDY